AQARDQAAPAEDLQHEERRHDRRRRERDGEGRAEGAPPQVRPKADRQREGGGERERRRGEGRPGREGERLPELRAAEDVPPRSQGRAGGQEARRAEAVREPPDRAGGDGSEGDERPDPEPGAGGEILHFSRISFRKSPAIRIMYSGAIS